MGLNYGKLKADRLERLAKRLEARAEMLRAHAGKLQDGVGYEYSRTKLDAPFFCAHAMWMWLGFSGVIPMCSGIFYLLEQSDNFASLHAAVLAVYGAAIMFVGFLRYLGPEHQG